MNEVLYILCRHCVSINGGWHPLPSTIIADKLNLSVGKVRYQLKKLKEVGLVESCGEGGMTEDGEVFYLRGFTITDKAKETEEYKKSVQRRKEIM
jgi:predicted transcriptional regulator